MSRALIVALIRAYQAAISPLLPASCRFVPTCSEYARVAVERHGAWRGGWLAVRRLLRCHPFGGHGFDPVPGDGEPAGEGKAAPAPPFRAGRPGS